MGEGTVLVGAWVSLAAAGATLTSAVAQRAESVEVAAVVAAKALGVRVDFCLMPT